MDEHYPSSPEQGRPGEDLPSDVEHPRGTLVIVCLFGLFFGAAWLATYLFVFLERGAPHP